MAMDSQVTVTANGETTEDLVLALEEAIRLISDGNTSGFGSNESGGFNFVVRLSA